MQRWALHASCFLAVCVVYAAASGCASPGADCRSSKCCSNSEHTCFEKNDYWGSCKSKCTPGIDTADPPEYQEPWSCKVIGTPPATPAPPPAAEPPADGDPLLTYMSGNLGRAKTTRYWDCCKPSCAWPDKARVSSPVKICDKDGKTALGPNSKSSCGGGGSGKGPSYMCSAQGPWYDAKRKMSFGFAAAHVLNTPEKASCCACYELRFEKDIPRMVVQVGNTGADLAGNQFDIQVPGGGFGIFDACSKQWNLPKKDSWGCRYGGIMCAKMGKAGCNKMPKVYRKSCEWQFDHLGDNPKVSSVYRVSCPAEITAVTGCVRDDDAEPKSPSPPADDGRRRRTPPPPRRRSSRRRKSTRRRGTRRRKSTRRRGSRRRKSRRRKR